ncbi:hypothetical protein [Streptomyces sp. NPDC051561]|uniref:hypothetical protein n=1 Tax=Streptomyces sp. NPDC051561 TaxID=3365658 RepID=UPI0037A4ABC7
MVTPSGAVRAGAELGGEQGGASGLVLGVGGAALLAATGTAFAVRRRHARGDHG